VIDTLTDQFTTTAVCASLGINHSNFRHFVTTTKVVGGNREVEDTLIRDELEKLIGDFPKYGYRMMTKKLNKDGFKIGGKPVNHKRVLRVMRENSLLCEIKKSFINTTDSNHDFFKYPNILKTENIQITQLDQVWVSDFTYIRLPEGFVYLAVILDAFSRKVIGYCLSKDMDTDLIVTALKMAITKRRIIDANLKIIHHSDQGVQYASKEYTDLLKFYGIRISMSDLGCPWQNGRAESFFKTLKSNEVYLNDYQNIWEAKRNLFKFIDDVYNAKRLHSSLGYVSPNEFEVNLLTKKRVQIAPSTVLG